VWGGNYCSEGVEGGATQEHVVEGASIYHEVATKIVLIFLPSPKEVCRSTYPLVGTLSLEKTYMG